jgi:hypothetical protein
MDNCDKVANLLLSLSNEELSDIIRYNSIGNTVILKLDNNIDVKLEPYTFYFSYIPKKITGKVIAIGKTNRKSI